MSKKMRRVISVGLCVALFFSLIIITGNTTVKADPPEIANPRTEDDLVTWDCVYFGNYYQSNAEEKEPIKWRVLSKTENDLFLISNRVLDVRPYHTSADEVTWEDCELRSWLNSEFLNAAFDENEQVAIKTTTVVNHPHIITSRDNGNNTNDKIFLLETQDLVNAEYGFRANETTIYAGDSRTMARITPYARSRGGDFYTDTNLAYNGKTWWWLRGKGHVNTNVTSAVTPDGGLAEFYTMATNIGIRPVLHLDSSKTDLWTYVGTVNSENEEVEWKEPEGIELNGYEVNNTAGGMRTIYTVTDTIDGKDVVEKGLIYGVGGYATENDIYIGSDSKYVASFAANEFAPATQNYSETLTSGTSYRMTLKFAGTTVKEYNTTWYVRAYAKLSDDTYVYSDVETYSIYGIADYLYQGKRMKDKIGHDYLYNRILSKVDSSYERIEFN